MRYDSERLLKTSTKSKKNRGENLGKQQHQLVGWKLLTGIWTQTSRHPPIAPTARFSVPDNVARVGVVDAVMFQLRCREVGVVVLGSGIFSKYNLSRLGDGTTFRKSDSCYLARWKLEKQKGRVFTVTPVVFFNFMNPFPSSIMVPR